jgi:hypothetical protein
MLSWAAREKRVAPTGLRVLCPVFYKHAAPTALRPLAITLNRYLGRDREVTIVLLKSDKTRYIFYCSPYGIGEGRIGWVFYFPRAFFSSVLAESTSLGV